MYIRDLVIALREQSKSLLLPALCTFVSYLPRFTALVLSVDKINRASTKRGKFRP